MKQWTPWLKRHTSHRCSPILPKATNIMVFYLGIDKNTQKSACGSYNIMSACLGEITIVFLSTPPVFICLATPSPMPLVDFFFYCHVLTQTAILDVINFLSIWRGHLFLFLINIRSVWIIPMLILIWRRRRRRRKRGKRRGWGEVNERGGGGGGELFGKIFYIPFWIILNLSIPPAKVVSI